MKLLQVVFAARYSLYFSSTLKKSKEPFQKLSKIYNLYVAMFNLVT